MNTETKILNKKNSLTGLKHQNQRAILQLLQKKNLSYADLSALLPLSYTGIINVAEEMITKGLLEKKDPETETPTKGRPSHMIGLNAGRGCVAVVNFCGKDLLRIYDLAGNQILEEDLEYDYVTDDVIAYLVGKLRQIVQTKLPSPLYAISVIAAGYIDKYSGRFAFAPHFEHYKDLDLKGLLGEFCGGEVEVKNIMYYRVLAERELGANPITNALLIDDFGSALCLDGKIYEGENGYAGELGSLSTDYFMEANEYTAEEYREDAGRLCSSTRIVRVVKERLLRGEESLLQGSEDPDIDKILEAYRQGDRLVCEVMSANARLFACTIKNIVGYLDLNTVIFGTGRSRFGEDYRAQVEAFLKKRGRPVTVCMSSFPDNSEALGACKDAIGRAYDKILHEMR